MGTRFDGFPPRGLTFLRQLLRHNDRDWFEARRSIYRDDVRAPALLLAEELNRRLERFAPAFVTAPRLAVPRLARDRRRDPTLAPYKTAVSLLFGHGGEKLFGSTGFAVRISGSMVTVGGGVYRPSALDLARIRRAIEDGHAALRRLLGRRRRTFGALQGAQLVRVPSSHDPDHPAADLLRHRQLYLEATVDPDLATSPRLPTVLAQRLRSLLPFVDWFVHPLGRGAAAER